MKKYLLRCLLCLCSLGLIGLVSACSGLEDLISDEQGDQDKPGDQGEPGDHDKPGDQDKPGEPDEPKKPSGLDVLKTYRIQHTSENGGTEYKSAEWVGNERIFYKSDGSISQRHTYDTQGRLISYINSTDTYHYRYEGEGVTGSSLKTYRIQYTTQNRGTEYKSAEWVGNELILYKSNGSVLSRTTYDTQDRIISTGTYRYRYEGEGVTGSSLKTYRIQYTSIDGGTEYKSAEWAGNEKIQYISDGSVLLITTYDTRERLTSYGTLYHYRYED
ncbi:hypothetical protein P0082_00490 [Candidatus Haliotispira prima]|uniref:RHS repeat protein n=1 Tax=Candidatus Haliotispira prima TaxID=3034016 RepID=A0ABY8MJI4_9SPIO|nr:hypothetical protein P0082_00490 [Candidatus Haliotispira prima]